MAAVILGVTPTILKTADIAAATSDVEKCRLNTILASTVIGKGFHLWDIELFRWDAPNPFRIDCPKRYSYVSNDNIKADGVNNNLETGNNEARERKLKDFILDEMTKCWKSFGDASDTIYSANADMGADIDTDETACFSCSEVFFGDDFETTEITDFYGHANEKRRLVSEESYFEFLTGGGAPGELPEFEGDDGIVLGKNRQWSTIFTIKKITALGYYDGNLWVPSLEVHMVPPVNAGIVGCNVVDESGNFVKADDDAVRQSIGCKDGKAGGFVFGKVARGVNRLSVDSPDGGAGRYPMTVRFIPTEDVFGESQCRRLY